ncbi:hypothetical protein QFZ48_005016 [Chitinophaga sp. W2I13]|uniref:hypothetical protein n=1 Tax=Chitinophaga sp. W2I13 TaxID=3373923 RepID=UPI003D1E24FF
MFDNYNRTDVAQPPSRAAANHHSSSGISRPSIHPFQRKLAHEAPLSHSIDQNNAITQAKTAGNVVQFTNRNKEMAKGAGIGALAGAGAAGVGAYLGVSALTGPVGLGLVGMGALAGGAYKYYQQSYANKEMERIENEQKGLYKRVQDAFDNGDIDNSALDALDHLQQEHLNLVDYVHRMNLDLPLPKDAKFTPEQTKTVQQNWNALRNETGIIKTNKDATPEFKKELRAMHAKLLSQPNGAELLKRLLETKQTLEIKQNKAPNLSRKEKQERVYRKHEINRELKQYGPELEEIIKQNKENVERAEKEETLDAYFDSEIYTKLMSRKRELEEQVGSREVEKDKYNSSVANADPAGKDVELRERIKDSEMVNEDKDHHPIPAPGFIVYGHELIHILNSRVTGKDLKSQTLGDNWHNKDEKHTIEGIPEEATVHNITENKLRDDHGLRKREWHTGKSREELEYERDKKNK